MRDPRFSEPGIFLISSQLLKSWDSLTASLSFSVELVASLEEVWGFGNCEGWRWVLLPAHSWRRFLQINVCCRTSNVYTPVVVVDRVLLVEI